MSDPKANYLKFTAPELEHDFVDLLKRVPLFDSIPDYLLHRIFSYSKFVQLKAYERPIQEGMYDQEIFILIKGSLEVYIKTETGEDLIDKIDKPFTLFGERCILGEARGASIESSGDSLLLGIDLSGLPDMIDAIEYPENKLADSEYRHNKEMYSLFLTVLLERLDKLIKDQYKLNQKLTRIHVSQNLKVSWWKQEVLLTKIFNEFCDNELAVELDTRRILSQVFDQYGIRSWRIDVLLKAHAINTSQVYIELVRLHSVGVVRDLNKVIYTIIRHLTADAHNSRRYMEALQTETIEFPKIVPLSYYLDTLHTTIINANILTKELSKEHFLDGFLVGTRLNPAMFTDYLEDGGWVNGQFGLAHIMYIACEICIRQVSEVNQAIAQYIKYITAYSTPKQMSRASLSKYYLLQDQFTKLFAVHSIDKSMEEEIHEVNVTEKLAASSPDHNIDDLLKEFGF